MSDFVLGVGHDLWISSAALASKGEILFATAEERLNRVKNYRGFPKNAIKACLDSNNLGISDISKVVIGWNPARHMVAYHGRYLSETRWRPEYLYNVPAQIISMSEDKVDSISIYLDKKIEVEYIDHHLAHATGSIVMSGFKDCFYYVLDGVGEIESSYYGNYDGTKLTKLGSVKYPNSIGLLYSAITEFLSFKPHSDEWKVMALSAYCKRENNVYVEKLKNLISINENGDFKIDTDYFSYHLPEQYDGSYTTDEFKSYIGLERASDKSCIKNNDYLQLAAAVQFVFEDSVFEILDKLKLKYDFNKICLSGGCFMNSVFNGKLSKKWGSDNIYIGPSPDDSGIALGAAYWGSGVLTEASNVIRKQQKQSYWGKSFTNEEVEKTLSAFKIDFKYYDSVDLLTRDVALQIADGSLVGWFQGRSEFGQRALGNRSILADPRSFEVKAKINSAVKFREAFRPFAPAILNDKVGDYFKVEANFESNYMEKVAIFRDEVRIKIPGVVHEDGSGRLQTVSKNENPLFYSLISEFNKVTGVPIILNTSLNVNGEPNVDSPVDAIRTFFSCGLDILVINNYLVKK